MLKINITIFLNPLLWQFFYVLKYLELSDNITLSLSLSLSFSFFFLSLSLFITLPLSPPFPPLREMSSASLDTLKKGRRKIWVRSLPMNGITVIENKQLHVDFYLMQKEEQWKEGKGGEGEIVGSVSSMASWPLPRLLSFFSPPFMICFLHFCFLMLFCTFSIPV